MGIVPVDGRNHRARTNNRDRRDRLVARPQQPVLRRGLNDGSNGFPWLHDHDAFEVERIALNSRVLIVEGISGSGKDTFQAYLKTRLKGRDVYDYSEGEVLQSWKHLQIEGIFELRVKFMKLFVNYVRGVVNREKNAVFLLNRFHLSAYVFTIIQQPELEGELDEIVNVLRTLPVHVFILQLHENDIEKRSLHPERSVAWRKFQQQIVKQDGFPNRFERYIWQQRLMLEKAEIQRIPYSIIKLTDEAGIGEGRFRFSETQSFVRPGLGMNTANGKTSRRKRAVPQTLKETV